jgi:hypothetical protein
MRAYNSDTDYPIVRSAASRFGGMAVVPIKDALREAGIRWFENDAEEAAINNDVIRAWQELGYFKGGT